MRIPHRMIHWSTAVPKRSPQAAKDPGPRMSEEQPPLFSTSESTSMSLEGWRNGLEIYQQPKAIPNRRCSIVEGSMASCAGKYGTLDHCSHLLAAVLEAMIHTLACSEGNSCKYRSIVVQKNFRTRSTDHVHNSCTGTTKM
jgi:hypothetical protein